MFFIVFNPQLLTKSDPKPSQTSRENSPNRPHLTCAKLCLHFLSRLHHIGGLRCRWPETIGYLLNGGWIHWEWNKPKWEHQRYNDIMRYDIIYHQPSFAIQPQRSGVPFWYSSRLHPWCTSPRPRDWNPTSLLLGTSQFPYFTSKLSSFLHNFSSIDSGN